MNDVITFTNPEFGRVRTIDIDAVTWFVGKDVANALGYNNSRKAIIDHIDEDDQRVIQKSQIVTFDIPPRGLTIINESGLYSLILSSKLPTAKKFKRWITSEVLPAIRKTGAYSSTESLAEPQRELTVDDYIKAAQILAGCKNERLPYVVTMLNKAGIDIGSGGDDVLKRLPLTDNDKVHGMRANALIREAIAAHGWTYSALANLLGTNKVQIGRYRKGQAIPREPLTTFYIDTLLKAIPALSEKYKELMSENN